MSLIRFNITGAVPLPLTSQQQDLWDRLRPILRILKTHSVVINPGMPGQEDITRFTHHICHHDTGGVCGVEQEI